MSAETCRGGDLVAHDGDLAADLGLARRVDDPVDAAPADIDRHEVRIVPDEVERRRARQPRVLQIDQRFQQPELRRMLAEKDRKEISAVSWHR